MSCLLRNAHALEQDRPDLLKRRQDWFDGQLDPDPARLVFIMDNLPSHKAQGVRLAIEGAGCRLLYLPPYSPDFNPIKKAFAKLKALLRAKAERTVEGLWNTVGQIVTLFEPQESANYFKSCGYDPE